MDWATWQWSSSAPSENVMGSTMSAHGANTVSYFGSTSGNALFGFVMRIDRALAIL